MTQRRDDPEIMRLRKRLADAQAELNETQRRGRENEPLVRGLGKHLKENRFAERLAASLRETRRHA